MYINDIVDLFANSDVYVKLYADDIKLYLDIISDSDQHTLQRSLQNFRLVQNLATETIANNKCQHNRISLSMALPSTDYFISDSNLPTVSSVRDLGVIVDNRLTFRDHINSIVSRGHLRPNQIWRCFICKDVCNLITAFITYVRPMLEYCSPVWSPVSVSLINQLEPVQRRFTKRLPGFQSRPHHDRCARLGIDRSELR